MEPVMGGRCAEKVAVVIGGTRGIGRATCLALADEGATVVVTGRSREDATLVAKAVEKRGTEGYPLPFDVADLTASGPAIDAIAERYGRIDILVPNAGINPYFERAERLTPEMWDEVMATNLRGIFFAMQAAAVHMLAQRAGSIVIVSSVTTSRGTLRGLPYVASKGGLDAMVRTLAVEWADRSVRVNAVAPGYIETDLTQSMRRHDGLRSMILDKTPMSRFGTASETADLIVFLASDAASYITGQVVAVDGGFIVG